MPADPPATPRFTDAARQRLGDAVGQPPRRARATDALVLVLVLAIGVVGGVLLAGGGDRGAPAATTTVVVPAPERNRLGRLAGADGTPYLVVTRVREGDRRSVELDPVGMAPGRYRLVLLRPAGPGRTIRYGGARFDIGADGRARVLNTTLRRSGTYDATIERVGSAVRATGISGVLDLGGVVPPAGPSTAQKAPGR